MSLVFRVTQPTPRLVSVQFVERGSQSPVPRDTVRGYAMLPVEEWESDPWRAVRAAGTEEPA
ncbi:MAG: hypothetical protein K2R93_12435 [Gemmatimonadaceae bacterium]|nr:hypothetical protein [Gemmatimonadaceae bacterium]